MLKRVGLILVMVMMWLPSAFAQWTTRETVADELRGNASYTTYKYANDGKYFVCWSDEKYIKVGCRFAEFVSFDGVYCASIGYYVQGVLVDKENTYFEIKDAEDNSGFLMNYTDRHTGCKILKHLQERGDVRILALLNYNREFDLVIPMNTELKFKFKLK